HLEIEHRDLFLVLPGGEEGGLVDEVLEIGADEAGRAARDRLEIDVRRDRDLLRVDAEDALATADVGPRDGDTPVKAAGAEDGRVEDVGAVGGRDDDDAVG